MYVVNQRLIFIIYGCSLFYLVFISGSTGRSIIMFGYLNAAYLLMSRLLQHGIKINDVTNNFSEKKY